jgi:hypothetical protein
MGSLSSSILDFSPDTMLAAWQDYRDLILDFDPTNGEAANWK